MTSPSLIERATRVFGSALGDERVIAVDPVMGGEDFSYFGIVGDIPIAIFWLGAVEPATIEAARAEGRILPSLHSSGFKADAKPAIRTGVTGMTALVLDLMAP